jgi:hypothetical protein
MYIHLHIQTRTPVRYEYPFAFFIRDTAIWQEAEVGAIRAKPCCAMPQAPESGLGTHDMKAHTLSCCALIVGCWLVSGYEQRTRGEPPRLPQEEPDVPSAAVGYSIQNDDARKPAVPIARSEESPANTQSARAGVDGAGNSATQSGLAVRIELDGTDNPRTLNVEEPFRVVLVNNSDQAIRIWNPETENGYQQFSFQLRNLPVCRARLPHPGPAGRPGGASSVIVVDLPSTGGAASAVIRWPEMLARRDPGQRGSQTSPLCRDATVVP